MALRHSLRLDVQLRTEHLDGLCALVAKASGRNIPTNKPITGQAAFLAGVLTIGHILPESHNICLMGYSLERDP